MNSTKKRLQKRRLILTFPAFKIEEPITYNLIKEYDIIVNILNADISHGKEGKLLVEMKGDKQNLDASMEYLHKHSVYYEPVGKSIIFNNELCVHCGACASVCFSGALEMNKADRALIFTAEKCIACELCIKACPLNLFELNFGLH